MHASSARFLGSLRPESRAAAAAAFEFRRSGREAYERAHWAQTERRRGGAGSSTDGTVFNGGFCDTQGTQARRAGWGS